jgi:O-antigen/teichoic acid export membrane protein
VNKIDRLTSPLRLFQPEYTHYLLGEVGAKALAFGTFVFIARYVGPADFGWISLYVTLSALLAVAVGAGLPSALVPFYFGDQRFSAVIGTTALGWACAVVGIGALAAILAPWAAQRLDVPAALVWAAIAGGIAISLRTAWLIVLRARKESRVHATAQFAEAALFAILIAGVMIVMPPDYRFVIACYTVPTAVVGIAGVLRLRRNPGFEFDRALVVPLLRFAVPMMFHAFAMTGLATSDQLVVNQLLGPDAAGRYAFAYRFGMAMMVLATAFSSAWLPDFLELSRQPDSGARIRANARRYVNVMIGGAMALMIALPPVVRMLGGDAYAEAPRIVPVVIYAYLWFVLYTLVFAHVMRARTTGAMAAASLSAFAVNIGLNYGLIPRLGLMGAALASVAGYAALFAIQLATHRHLISGTGLAGLTARVALAGLVPLLLSSSIF